jgi:hypothetical protein
MIKESIFAIVTTARALFKSRRALVLMSCSYAGLLVALYLLVSTREATMSQLILTMTLVVVAPALFFLLQALSVSYATGPPARGLIGKCFKLIVISVPLVGVTLLALYGLGKVQSYATITTTLRYLLIGVAAPLLAIQLWIGTSLRKAFAPQSVFVYALGFLIFAVAPYFLIIKTIQTERAWLELSLLLLRLSTAAVLVLLGWVTTVGAIAVLNHRNEQI